MLEKIIKKLEEYNEIIKFEAIARRYLIMNAFDGALTILGIVIGSFIANITDVRFIIIAGVGAGIAMGVSGFWGAYLTEKAERTKELKDLERSMLSRLKKTKIGRATRVAPYVIALVDGLAPFFAVLIILSPFFLFQTTISYYFSISLAFFMLFLLGLFLGKVSKENLIISGMKMVFAGIICIILSILLGYTEVF